jgi:hypothetical protein
LDKQKVKSCEVGTYENANGYPEQLVEFSSRERSGKDDVLEKLIEMISQILYVSLFVEETN